MAALSKKNIWEATPVCVKQTVGRVVGLLPPRLLLGRRFREMQRLVESSHSWSAEQAREFQLSHLRQALSLAYDKTSHYRRSFDAVGFDPRDLKSPEQLALLPTIDKQTVRDHLNELATMPLTSRGIDRVSTGGSSGQPLRFYIDANRSAAEYAHLVAGWQRIGYRLDIPQVVIRGQVVPPDRRGLRHMYDPVLRRHYYSNFHMSDENMGRYVEHLRTVGPCFLHVYPSSITMLTCFIMRAGLEPPRNVKGVLAGSENVYAEDRATVERVWGVPYHSWYGHSEKLVLAAECEHTRNYHVWPTYGYFELLDDDGKPITTPGVRGEIVGTGFINTVMPFIRYRTGDYATFVGDRCVECGREHPIISDIEGRWPSGALVAADGALVTTTALNVHDDTFERVRQYQFYQDTIGEVTVRVVPTEDYSDDDHDRILRTLERRLGRRMLLKIEVRETLPLTQRGKAVWVVQKLDVGKLSRQE